jgi:glycosyltransferase involved in cell wall biosynthesis
MELSVVVPVYREQDNVPEFLRRVIPILESVTDDFEIIFALDPAPDRTEALLREAHAQDPRIRMLKFSRRFGQPMATLAGLHQASGQAVIIIDVDLQDPPELIPEMVARWRAGYDVVLPQRRTRTGEPWTKRLIAGLGYKVINKLADVEIPRNTGDFRLLGRRVVEQIKRLPEHHGFLRGLVALVGFRQTTIPFDRPPRFAGQGNYNRWMGSLRIGLNGIFCFSSYPLTLSSMLGFGVATFAFLMAVIYLVMKLVGFPFPIGNPTIVILMLFLGGVQLITIGILGEYLSRIYDEVRRRPKFIIDEALGFARAPARAPDGHCACTKRTMAEVDPAAHAPTAAHRG